MSKTYILSLIIIGVFLFIVRPIKKDNDLDLDKDVYADDVQEKIKDKYASEGIPSDVPLTPNFIGQSSTTTTTKQPIRYT